MDSTPPLPPTLLHSFILLCILFYSIKNTLSVVIQLPLRFICTIFPCRFLLGLSLHSRPLEDPRCGHERLQQEGPDIAEQCLCNQRPGAAGGGSQHRLLVVPGGGRHHASEPERRHQDLVALRPVESLLPGR